MSLRSFHILFIVVVTLFLAAVATWTLVIDESGDSGLKFIGYIAAAGAVISPAYGIYFYNKVKNLL